jgi:Raf kinase inhibitor-like YbhB/YbcL family protein
MAELGSWCRALVASVVALCACGGDDFGAQTTSTGTGGSSTGQGGGSAGDGGGGEAQGGGGGAGGAGTGGAAGDDLVLQSFAHMEGATFDDMFTCAGSNISLPLDWLPADPATQSYAVVFADESFDHFLHWVIWDIPTSVLALAGNVSKVPAPPMPSGAKQAKSYDGATHGYLGPCPGGEEHTYEFVLHAVDVATLPGVTTDSTMGAVEAAVLSHSLATGRLSGKSSASPP